MIIRMRTIIMPATELASSTIVEGMLGHRLAPLLRRSWHHLNQIFRHRISEHGLTPDQFTVLRWLNEARGISQRHLAELMAVDENTIASLVARMEDSGLIERRGHASDGRRKVLEASPTGEAVFRRIQPIATDLQDKLMSSIPKAERAGFLLNLARIAEAGCQTAQREKAVRRARRR